jgi:hypothetical protein
MAERDLLLAEFERPEALIAAVRRLVADGYRSVETYTPLALPEIETLTAQPRSPISWIAFAAGMLGAAGAYALQWWTNAWDFVYHVGGKPPHWPPAFVPITFEMGVLGASLAAFLGALLASGLPRLAHAVFTVDGFERASVDRYWLSVAARDPRFDPARTPDLLVRELGALRVARTVPEALA